MSDEQTPPELGDQPPEGNQPPRDDQPPGPVPYERFRAVNEQRQKALAELEQLRAAEKTRKEQELAEQNKWQQLAEQREKELQAERLNNTRLKVAAQKGIPAELIDRLQGSTEEEIAADADGLLQFLKPTKTPGTPPAGRAGNNVNLDIANMTPKQIREKTAELLGKK